MALRMCGFVCVMSLLAAGSACVREHDIALRISAPDEVSSRVSRWTVRVYEQGCPSLAQVLTDEDRASGPVYDRTGPAGTLPPVGTLSSERYFVAALGRDETCVPVGFGCTEVRLDDGPAVVVTVAPTEGPGGPICPRGLTCDGGVCAMPAGPSCVPCVEPDGVTGCMCAGRCVEPPAACEMCGIGCSPTGECMPAQLAIDPANCGACRHVCPAGLGCTAGLCRPAPVPTTVPLDVVVYSGTDITRAAVVVVWQTADATSDPDAIVTSFGVDGPGGFELQLARVVPSEAVLARIADSTGGFATARVSLASDDNGDGAISPDELAATTIIGVADVAVGYAVRELGPGDSSEYPEGMLPDAAFYRLTVGSVGVTFVPASTADRFTLVVCSTGVKPAGPPPDCVPTR